MKVYIVLYETMYNKNICCCYTRHYIITNIFIIRESVYRLIRNDVSRKYLLLYKTYIMKNKYFSFTLKCISSYTRRCIREIFILHYICLI